MARVSLCCGSKALGGLLVGCWRGQPQAAGRRAVTTQQVRGYRTRCTASQGEPGLEAHSAFLPWLQLAVTPLRLGLCRWTCLALGAVPTLPFNMHPGRYRLIWNSQ